MTTEDDFQRALDENPDDWQTRLVFADWLQERGDQRAEGYRALGTLRRYPSMDFDPTDNECPYFYCVDRSWSSANLPHSLPDLWFDSIDSPYKSRVDMPSWRKKGDMSRKEVEDIVAETFARLRPETKAKLLATVPA